MEPGKSIPQNLSELITISCPVELARIVVARRDLRVKYETNREIKAVGLFLLWKAQTTSGLIKSWNQQKHNLCLVARCSEFTLRGHIKLLLQLQLIKIIDGDIQLASWEDLARIYEIDITEKFCFKYDYQSKQKLHWWIVATDIQDNQNRQRYKCWQRLNKNPEHKAILLKAVIAGGADLSRINDPEYFLSQLRPLYLASHLRVSEIHDLLIQYRPFLDRGVKGMATACKAKCKSTASYIKKRLQSARIILVQKLSIESQERARNPFVDIKWLTDAKQTMLRLADFITVFPDPLPMERQYIQ